MKTDSTWVNVSVFYNMKSWNTILNSCLRPSLALLERRSWIEGYFIHFSKNQGDHLRISCLVSSNHVDDVRQILSNDIKKYISAFPSITDQVKYPLSSIFKNFPNNSVNFNIYKNYAPESEFLNSKELLSLRQLISNLIIAEMAQDIIEEESVFTFGLYMQLGVLKAIFERKDKSILQLREHINNLIFNTEIKSQVLADKKIADLYIENKELLLEIFNEVWNEMPEADWLFPWISTCKDFYTRVNFSTLFSLLNHLVFEHISYLERNSLLITSSLIYNCYFLEKTILKH